MTGTDQSPTAAGYATLTELLQSAEPDQRATPSKPTLKAASPRRQVCHAAPESNAPNAAVTLMFDISPAAPSIYKTICHSTLWVLTYTCSNAIISHWHSCTLLCIANDLPS